MPDTPKTEKQPKRALIEYRTKAFDKADAKWSLYFQRIIDAAVDTPDALRKFYGDPSNRLHFDISG